MKLFSRTKTISIYFLCGNIQWFNQNSRNNLLINSLTFKSIDIQMKDKKSYIKQCGCDSHGDATINHFDS